jgi:peptidyl-prolyl cis-trans isomerase A (cyclophilin A)
MGSLVHGFVLAVLLSGAQTKAPKPVVVVLETEKGAIEIEVDVARAPNTAANFLKYVDGGYYNGGEFHRAVRPDTERRTEFPIEVVQARRARGADAPPGFPPIALERTSVTGLKHLAGTVSMARSGPDTATNEFFICLRELPELDFAGKRNADGQGFAAFGRVVRGMEIVKAIQMSPVGSGETLSPTIRILKARRK